MEIVTRLQFLATKDALEVDEAALSLIAARANGSLHDAETTLDQLSLLDRKVSLAMVEELVSLFCLSHRHVPQPTSLYHHHGGLDTFEAAIVSGDDGSPMVPANAPLKESEVVFCFSKLAFQVCTLFCVFAGGTSLRQEVIGTA